MYIVSLAQLMMTLECDGTTTAIYFPKCVVGSIVNPEITGARNSNYTYQYNHCGAVILFCHISHVLLFFCVIASSLLYKVKNMLSHL